MKAERFALVLGLALCATVFSHGASAAGGPAVTMQVMASGFKSTKGQAIVAIYGSKDSWLKLDRAVKVVKMPLSGTSLQVSFSLPPGVYAASVIHDENSNGKLDMQWFPIPKPAEGAGVSNDATASIGPPSYGDARFEMTDKGAALAIKIRY
jgi:uncharacterized protein (DUF2141 family)